MNKFNLVATAVTVALLAGCSTGNDEATTAHQPMFMDGLNPNMTAAQFTELCDTTLAKAKADFSALELDNSKATLASVMGASDKISEDLQALNPSWYMRAVHPNEALRDAANKCSEAYSDFGTAMSMSRPFYERVSAIDLSEASDSERFMVEKSLKSFRQSGVDKDKETREAIRALRQEITEIGNAFNKNIREDVRYVETTVDALKGLPQDYIDNHQPDENGVVKISTDYPDLFPVMTYADSDDLRKSLRIASRSRGYPQNDKILKSLIEKRHELALMLGYKNFASLSMDDKMIGTPENAQAFLTSVGEALKGPVKKEMGVYLKRLQQIDPSATEVNVWQASYLKNLIQQEQYSLDSKEVREYFSYEKVRAGIFKLTEDLFDVQIRPWVTDTWHEDVESYEMVENGNVIGRFYMDNHPRDNKFKHAAHWGMRNGIVDTQIPMSGLAQNFPKGLMEHGQVETFLHEFGHLLHNVFSGNQKWHGIAGMSMERDFVEAPSQMLEEWIWDYETLKGFATNAKGEVIPRALVDKMNRARDFGLAVGTATQVFYANLSLNYYSRDPESFELMPLMKEIQDKYAPYPYVEGTAFYSNFGHLNGYSSNYYTYQWSLAIATDMFSKFEQQGLRNKDISKAYRKLVLGAAGSKPAKDFVAEFLGREFSPEAYIKKLGEGS